MRCGGGAVRVALLSVPASFSMRALAALSYAHTLASFALLLVIATVGSNIALSAYQVLLPESVPCLQWALCPAFAERVRWSAPCSVSASRGRNAGSFAHLFVTAVIMAAGGLTLFGISGGTYDRQDTCACATGTYSLAAFAARTLVFFGLTVKMFVLCLFSRRAKIYNPSAGTALYAIPTIVGAVLSSIYLGLVSDRVPRKIVTALAIAAMAAATIGFALAPGWRGRFLCRPFRNRLRRRYVERMGACVWMRFQVMRDVGRDLGLWGIATSLPNIVAPLVGGGLIALFGGTRAGYQAVFALSGFSFALASLTVLRVGRRPLSSLWAWPLRFARRPNFAWDHLAYRVRSWAKYSPAAAARR